MKKVIIFLVSSLCFFTACSPTAGGGSDSSANKNPTDTENTTETDNPEISDQSSDDDNNGGENSSVITYFGTKEPTEIKEVGDIVFKDGSATPYTSELTLTDEQKEAAIAIIFYKGTDLNNDIYKETDNKDKVIWEPGDTTTIRTLGVGLKHEKSGLPWCLYHNLEPANAYNRNITTIQCDYDNSDGIYIFTGKKNGSNNFKYISDFLIEHHVEDDTGVVEKYPSFHFAKNYKNVATNIVGTKFESGWYIPSVAELYQIYVCMHDTSNGINIDTASELCGGDMFKTGKYWSSSQYNLQKDVACRIIFSDGKYDVQYKGGSKKTDNQSYVCVIHEF